MAQAQESGALGKVNTPYLITPFEDVFSSVSKEYNIPATSTVIDGKTINFSDYGKTGFGDSLRLDFGFGDGIGKESETDYSGMLFVLAIALGGLALLKLLFK